MSIWGGAVKAEAYIIAGWSCSAPKNWGWADGLRTPDHTGLYYTSWRIAIRGLHGQVGGAVKRLSLLGFARLSWIVTITTFAATRVHKMP
ncbi:hypothetical protein LMG27177_02016 [Paraburkholderia fynbosensis]|uniref:Uncharacterized protein n=1 Tax=Paraburkholderia fynbosensis TaxID=1200993 RepID=A0A6J5FT55_9BURK|nr:hypothetical protein LMG27177_02016 [Paraburkholderia fynbosensis]